jgi:hypothetical protein
MSRRRAARVARDQEPSAFSAILERLCHHTAARGAAFVDVEGETVDYAGVVSPFSIKVTAAEWRLILQYLGQSALPAWVATHELIVRAQKRSYLLYKLGDGYALVLELPRLCFSVSERALLEAAEALCNEAGLDTPEWCRRMDRYRSVRVRAALDDSHRPGALWHGDAWREVSVLGRYAEASFREGEIGYRVRLEDGNELSLGREPLGHWYVDAQG